MRRKGQRRRLPAERARARQRRADHGAVAAMNAVEIADRHHRAGQRAAVDALRAAARDVELFRGKLGPLIGRPSDYLVIRNAYLPSFGAFQSVATVSAPLTNLQINPLFKAHCYQSPPLRGAPGRADAQWLST